MQPLHSLNLPEPERWWNTSDGFRAHLLALIGIDPYNNTRYTWGCSRAYSNDPLDGFTLDNLFGWTEIPEPAHKCVRCVAYAATT